MKMILSEEGEGRNSTRANGRQSNGREMLK